MNGIELIKEERERQIGKEGWTAKHDEQHVSGELALAAICYAAPVPVYIKRQSGQDESFIDPWPWWDEFEITRYGDGAKGREHAWDKRKKHSQLRRLVIAGALIAAEIDRLQRLASVGKKEKGK